MQILYTINKNEDIDIYNKLFNKSKTKNELLVNSFGKFYSLSDQLSDFFYIKNYDVNKILKLNDYKDIVTIKNRGFEVNYDSDIDNQNYVFLTKIKAIRHTVKPLQTLNEIAGIYGVDKEQIIFNNNLMTEKLFIGQIVYI